MFFNLFLEVTKHSSLSVSSPLLQVWLRILRPRDSDFSDVIQSFMGPLLELCSQRSIRYDSLPADSRDPAVLFLTEDCDTLPLRDMLLTQHRQACVGIVELIVRRVPTEAIQHIFGEAATFFRGLQNQPFSPREYIKLSPLSLQADSHFTVMEAGTRGCLKWIHTKNEDTRQEEELREVFAQWCQTALSIPIEDPDIKRKIITQVVSITCKLLVKQETVGFATLENLLSIRSRKEPASQQYTDSARELLETCAYGAQKLATVFADQFLTIYDQLEQKIQEIVDAEGVDLQPRYAAFLVMIIHRSSNLDTAMRTEKLRRMIQPVKEAWENAELVQAVSDYPSFCRYLGWDRLPEFFSSTKFEKIQDWGSQPLDEVGRSFQADLLSRNDRTPIKLTKALLHATTEKLEEGTPIHAIACTVWEEVMTSILPVLLKMMANATRFHNPEEWARMPEGVQYVIKRMLTDRFWQNGISAESRDAFVSKVTNSKYSLEGFGSTVRRTVRQVRVGCCDIVLLFSRLGTVFYGFPDLPEPLSSALYESSQALSAHHFSILITFSSQLINGCPPHLRQLFLPPVLSKLFHQLVNKVTSEWESMNKRTEQAAADDNLDEEMKNQSILRSMTYNGCYLIFSLLTNRRGKLHGHEEILRSNERLAIATDKLEASASADTQSVFHLITTNFAVLEPVLLFAKSCLGVRDTHSVTCMLSTLHLLIPRFHEPGPVRTFVTSDLLKAAITSLHEPYFVDVQKELATLIVHIILLDSDAAAMVILSLPGLAQQPEKVNTAIERVCNCTSDRMGRALVLELLEQIRGVSISEMGRIGGPKRSRRGAKLLEQYDMTVDKEIKIERGGSPGLEGVAGLLQ
jgi:exportin-5